MRLRLLLPILSVFFVSGMDLSLAQADDWSDYRAFLANYFFVDKQEFSQATCDLEIPLVASIAEESRKLPDSAVQVTDTLGHYRVTLKSDGAISIESPTLDMKTISRESGDAGKALDEGIAQIQEAFRTAVTAANGMVKASFDDLLYPAPDQVKNLKFSTNAGKSVAEFDRGAYHVTQEYSGATRHDVYRGTALEGTSEISFTTVGGKQAVASAELSNLASKSAKLLPAETANTSIEYQQVSGKFWFPSTKTVTYGSSSNENGGETVKVWFRNCKVE